MPVSRGDGVLIKCSSWSQEHYCLLLDKNRNVWRHVLLCKFKDKRWGQIRNVPKKQVFNRLRAFKTMWQDADDLWIQFSQTKIFISALVAVLSTESVSPLSAGSIKHWLNELRTRRKWRRATRDGSSSMCFLFDMRVRVLPGR